MATARQKRAAEILVENGGKSVSKAMREAGYSPQTAKTPQKLTESVGWQELIDQYLPDGMILEALHDDIKSKKRNRKAELELALKIKGRMVERQDLTTDGHGIQFLVVRNSDETSKD